MSKPILKAIKKITEDNETKNLVIFTSHLKIEGQIFIPEGKCDECADDYLALENAQICRIDDYCSCNGDQCECNDYICFRYDWLSVNLDEIVAFTVVE